MSKDHIVYVATENGKPIRMLLDTYVEATPDATKAAARKAIIPPDKLASQRMVPYVSVDFLENYFKIQNMEKDFWIKRLLAHIREECP